MAPRPFQEGSWGGLGSSWGGLGVVLEGSGVALGRSGGLLGRSWGSFCVVLGFDSLIRFIASIQCCDSSIPVDSTARPGGMREAIKPDSAVNGKRRIPTLKGILNAYYTYRCVIYFDNYRL